MGSSCLLGYRVSFRGDNVLKLLELVFVKHCTKCH